MLSGILVALLVGCSGADAPPATTPATTSTAPSSRRVVLSIVGTNDLHGHVRALPILAGHINNLRRRRGEDGAVLLLDGGDLFQGTLVSNLAEGAPVIDAYNLIGYSAASVGNHEFDYGPEGEAATPSGPGDDPRGALRARARQARFPLLAANIYQGQRRVDWQNAPATTMLTAGGVRVGVIGVTTESTPHTTIAANFAGLRIRPLAETIAEHARRLRGEGARVVIVTSHAGGRCESFGDPHDLSSCEADQEIFEVARALPRDAVDVIVAGHTHRGVAHWVNGVAIIESHAYGRAFGRVDLTVELPSGRLVDHRIYPPHELCREGRADDGDCVSAPYEGEPVTPDERVISSLAPSLARARVQRERPLGVVAGAQITRTRTDECPLGNLIVDLMRAARPDADVALTNGGGLRAPLPAGPLTYGRFYEAQPFDNRFAHVTITGAELTEVMRAALTRQGSFLSVSGVRVQGRCRGGQLEVRLTDERGRAIPPTRRLHMVTSDFLATGGDRALTRVASGEVASASRTASRSARTWSRPSASAAARSPRARSSIPPRRGCASRVSGRCDAVVSDQLTADRSSVSAGGGTEARSSSKSTGSPSKFRAERTMIVVGRCSSSPLTRSKKVCASSSSSGSLRPTIARSASSDCSRMMLGIGRSSWTMTRGSAARRASPRMLRRLASTPALASLRADHGQHRHGRLAPVLVGAQ